MTATAFAALENSLATAMLAAFTNITLTDGVQPFGAVIDRGVEFVGEFNLSADPRDRITVLKSEAARFANGLVVNADPAAYTVDEILALPRSSWTLDRLASDDGHVVVWWLK